MLIKKFNNPLLFLLIGAAAISFFLGQRVNAIIIIVIVLISVALDFYNSYKSVQMNLLDPGWLRTDLGGPNAPNAVESVIPGALVPALLDDGVSGRFFRAQDYAGMTLEQAVEAALK